MMTYRILKAIIVKMKNPIFFFQKYNEKRQAKKEYNQKKYPHIPSIKEKIASNKVQKIISFIHNKNKDYPCAQMGKDRVEITHDEPRAI